MIDLEVTLFYIPLSGFRVCNLYNRAEVRPSQIVNTRVHNLQIIETQIKLAKVIQISLAERIAVFRHQLFCGPLKMRRVPEKAVFGTEYLFRTGNACFLHRMPLKMRRVPQEAFLSTECVFRTVEGPLRYRMPQSKKGESHC